MSTKPVPGQLLSASCVYLTTIPCVRPCALFILSGGSQVCCSVERIYVDVAVKDEFEKRVVDAARAYAVGPGSDPASRVGPMVSAMQRDIVAKQVRAKGVC